MKSGGNWIKSAIKKPGSFTAQANKAGMSVPAFRDKVLSNKSDYSSTTVKRANLAKTLAGMRKGENGMLNTAGTKTVKNIPLKTTKGQNKEMPRMTTVSSRDKYGVRKAEDGMEMDSLPKVKVMDPLNLAAKTTLNQLESSMKPKGASDKVKAYQEMLRSKGYNIAADGAWGTETQKAYESYIKSKSVAASKPNTSAPKTTSISSSKTWNYTPAQWDAAQKENSMRSVAGSTYGPTRANMMKTMSKSAYTPPKAPISAPGKSIPVSKKPDVMPAWAQKVVAQNNKKKLSSRSPIKLK